ncbi:unnamed protein product, partial [Medioppia subpectinata]
RTVGHANYIANADSDKAEWSLHAILGDLDLDLATVIPDFDIDGCKYTPCPVKKGDKKEFSYKLTIPDDTPTVEGAVKARLIGDKGDLFCGTVHEYFTVVNIIQTRHMRIVLNVHYYPQIVLPDNDFSICYRKEQMYTWKIPSEALSSKAPCLEQIIKITMFKIGCFVLLITAVSAWPPPIDCGHAEITNIDITGCTTIPCTFHKGKEVTIDIDYIANQNSTKSEFSFHAIVGGLDLDLSTLIPGFDSDGCHDTHCPIKKGGKKQFSYNLTIPMAAPTIEAEAKLRLIGDKGDLFCTTLYGVIKD